MRENPLAVAVGVPTAAYLVFVNGWYAVRGERLRSHRARPIEARLGWALLTVIVLFTVLRNVPLPIFDVLRPLPL